MKGISEFIALLIVVGIVIGAAIVGSGIISNILMKQSPKGADIVGKLFWLWEKLDNGYVLYIHGPLTNVGSEVVNITRIEVSYGGKKYNADFTKMTLHPGEYNEILARTAVDTLPPTSTVTVIVYYCTPSGCSTSIISATVRMTEYVSMYEVVTVTLPVGVTIIQTVTTTVPRITYTTVTQTVSTTTTVTTTRTVSQIVTTTVATTQTVTRTTTATATSTVIKPAWLIDFSACYSVYNNIIVVGTLDKPVNKDAEYIPYVAKYFKCSVFGCSEVAVKPFDFVERSIISSYGPIDPPWFGHFKVEVWSVDPSSGQLLEKMWESNVDPNTRCA
ncbi:hypothetical protein Igag_1962 [Ignisphaera aggregans DSM 17230]|uniref:Uncharacterized protein n=1 Tax=Ignisphaera aggregans (strain DSM 17230 / JCM 13409 / AQ1.S1) TaxID=583356 RepID=E0STG8_IGNAA|nr:hypothetical protein Igag_1962 [Ignisphaera aggregans DSM 17230]